VFRLLTEPPFLAEAADGILTGEEQALLSWPRRPRGLKAAAWSATDALLVDEAADVIGGTATFGHVVADEAQDLSPMQLRAIGRRCRFGSATLLGDLAQRTTPWSAERWEDALGHLGRRSTRAEHLPRAFRAPKEVLDYANRLLPQIAPGVRPAGSVRSVPGSLRVRSVDPASATAAWLRALDEALAEEGSVGLVAADPAVDAIGAELAAAASGSGRSTSSTPAPGSRSSRPRRSRGSSSTRWCWSNRPTSPTRPSARAACVGSTQP
jgi:hypothetical protein